MTKYPIEIKAMTLVYLRESNLRRNDKGMTMSLVYVVNRGDVKGQTQSGIHEGRDPKMPVYEEMGGRSIAKAAHDARHQVADDDEIANANAETLDGNGGVKDDGSIGVGHLAEGEEAGRAAVEISGAARLQVQAEAGGEARPEDDQDSEQDAHVGEGRGHGQHAGADDGVDEVDDAAEPAGLASVARLFAVSRAARLRRRARRARSMFAGRTSDCRVAAHALSSSNPSSHAVGRASGALSRGGLLASRGRATESAGCCRRRGGGWRW